MLAKIGAEMDKALCDYLKGMWQNAVLAMIA